MFKLNIRVTQPVIPCHGVTACVFSPLVRVILEKLTGTDLSFTAGVREAAGPRRHPTTTPLLQVAAATVGYYCGTSGKAVNLNLFLLLLLLRLDTEWSLKRRNLACCGFFSVCV